MNSFLTHEEPLLSEDIISEDEVDEAEFEVKYYDDLSKSYSDTKDFLKNAVYYCVFEKLTLQSYLTFCKRPQSCIRILQKEHVTFLQEHKMIISMLYPFSKKHCSFEQFENLVCRYSFIHCNCRLLDDN